MTSVKRTLPYKIRNTPATSKWDVSQCNFDDHREGIELIMLVLRKQKYTKLQDSCSFVIEANDQFSNQQIVSYAEMVVKEDYESLAYSNDDRHNISCSRQNAWDKLVTDLSEVDQFTYNMIQEN